MNSLKLRRLLIQIHLYLAGFLAPGFLLVAISGGMDLAGFDARTTETAIELPAGADLDFSSDTIVEDVRALLETTGTNVNFEYIRGRGNSAMTRPTSHDFVRFEKSAGGLTATLNEPNLQYSLMELHKGHGPRIFRTYQIVAPIALFLVVIGGLAVGLLARAYRRPTIVSAAIGTIGFVALASGII